jgi:SPX domain protein involved in polyphosphate accumulation/uncharacterized membrane protein YidH (DUF202 family)
MKKLIKEIVQTEKHAHVDPEVYASQLWWYDSTQKTSLGSIPEERIAFIRLVESEINKTSQYYMFKRKWISSMISEIQQRIDGDFAMDDLIQDIDDIAAELLLLDRFIHQEKQLLLKITKKHDKCTSNYKVNTWMLIRLEREEFWNPKIDDIIIGLSDAYAVASAAREGKGRQKDKSGKGASSPAASEDFVRKNEKYFVKPEDVLYIKLAIIRHLPLDIYGRVRQKNGMSIPNIETLADLKDSTVINSIYLDNRQKTMYHERTGIETPKGNLIRVRWYGTHPNPSKECFVERKTRQTQVDSELYEIDEAIKERFLMNERNVKSYISGEWTIEKKVDNMLKKKRIGQKEASDLKRKANSIQKEITEKSLNPVLRTVVRRSAFQRGTDQTLRFSLDTNLHIINETVPKDQTQWARDLSQPLKLAEVKTLPYAILEVKTQANAPEWVDELIHSGYLIPAANYSKFLYGTCKLWPDAVRFTPNWWNNVMSLEKHSPASPSIDSTRMFSKLQNPFIRPRVSSIPTIPPPPTPSHTKKPSSQPSSDPLPSQIAPLTIVSPTLPPSISSKLPPSIIISPPLSPLSPPILSPSLSLASLENGVGALEKIAAKAKAKKARLSLAAEQGHGKEAGTEMSELKQTGERERDGKRDGVWLDLPKEGGKGDSEDTRVSLSSDEDASGDSSPRKEKWVSKLVGDMGWLSIFGLGSGGGMVEYNKMVGSKRGNKQKTAEQRVAKAFFANERTLLSWLNTATFLSLTGLTMINTESSVGRASGFALTLVTVVFACYALFRYLQRTYELSRPQRATTGDKVGPPLLILAFCVTLLFSAAYFFAG